jgi:membrane fusion protein (multidrug efflux system)
LYWTTARFEESTDDAYVRHHGGCAKGRRLSAWRPVADNQKIKAGQLLAKTDDRDFLPAINQA